MRWLKFIALFLFVTFSFLLLPSQYGGFGSGKAGISLSQVLSAISDSTYWRLDGSVLEYRTNTATIELQSNSSTSGATLYFRGRNGTLQGIFGTGGINNELTFRANQASGGNLRFDSGGANQRMLIEADGDYVFSSITGENTLPSSPANGTFQFLNVDDSDADTIAIYNGTGWKYFISQ